MKRHHLPNLVTLFRIFLIIPYLYFLLKEQFTCAFFTFLLAGISDGFDGFLARRFGWTSPFGAMLDPLADKLLMMSSYCSVAWLGLIPLWFFVVVILRDIVIISGVGGVFYIRGEVYFKPSFISKLNTLLQIMFITLILFESAYWDIPNNIIDGTMYVIAMTTVSSVVGYVITGIKQAFFTKI